MMSQYQRQIFEETVLQRLDAIEAKLAQLDARTVGLIRLGPKAAVPDQKEIAETVQRVKDLLEIGD